MFQLLDHHNAKHYSRNELKLKTTVLALGCANSPRGKGRPLHNLVLATQRFIEKPSRRRRRTEWMKSAHLPFLRPSPPRLYRHDRPRTPRALSCYYY